jgi:polyisoprenoid-binding protein YceI
MKNITLVFVAIVLLNAAANAQNPASRKIYCDKSNSTITYDMNHPLHEWTGVSKEVTSIIITDENRDIISQVAVSVKFSSFDSKNANRDSHAIEVAEAIKYPNITFNSKSIKQEGNKLSVEGTLNFHGVNKDIAFVAEKSGDKNKIQVTGGFEIKMTDFKIDPPSLMAIATDDEIKIKFSIVY